ncbi:putative L-aspartate dehydrogenase [Anneissia japonica]|uniref:putative L-aspartate dehydrogenase n=1 Tax=Anneissia japonica TaxID=1529436 RepID=UPI0014254C41|nr:putative L-aspartate dehydrogenase [Anneissia japonica]
MASDLKKQKIVRRVGIVGYGHLGQYLVNAVQESDQLELAFVWNRTAENMMGKVDDSLILQDLSKFEERKSDLIVEVAHPTITTQYGEAFLRVADYMIGSPTALANQEVENKLRAAAIHNGLYIPNGAFWGGNDIKKMADRGTLHALKVTMTKHPTCFKLNGELKEKNAKVKEGEIVTLYDGPVRDLCPLAPNNVNTMAAASIAAHNLGFDKVQGCLVADSRMTDWHIVEVEVTGPGDVATGHVFNVSTKRKNPSKLGVVTGNATYASFVSSMLGAKAMGPGVHLC